MEIWLDVDQDVCLYSGTNAWLLQRSKTEWLKIVHGI